MMYPMSQDIAKEIEEKMTSKGEERRVMLTAKEARSLTENNQAVVDVKAIIALIEQAAKEGQSFIKTRDYEFGSGKCYCREESWPNSCKVIVKKLRELGFKCELKSKEMQFVDVWLEVSW